MTRVALYARVSTRDKGQDPELQLVPLREYCSRRGWTDVSVYVDQAPAGDLARRVAWRRLLGDAARRRVDLVLVWKLDRAFRSTLDALGTLRELEHRGVGFAVVTQPELDTTSPLGRLMLTMLAAFAELERELIAERVREGMANARRRGARLGRPGVLEDPRRALRWRTLGPAVIAGEISLAAAARELGVSRAALRGVIRTHERGTQ